MLISFTADGELPPSLAERIGHAPGDVAKNTRLAAKLKQIESRRFDDDGLRIERAGADSHSKAALWRVTKDASAGNGLPGPSQ